jgi:CheY-like chemotaxis protein
MKDLAQAQTTDQQHTVAELRQQVERLMESNPIKDRFVSLLAHELRNPIAAIAMAAEALVRLCADAADKRAMAEVVHRQALQASRLLDDLLDLSRIASGKLELHQERTNLADQLRALVASQQPQLDAHGMQVQWEPPEQPIWINADAVRIAQVLGRLVNNALKFSQPGGRLSIRVRRQGADQVEIELADSGAGIEPARLPTLFEPFTRDDTVRQTGGGLGLGLPLAKGLVELHGGSIQAFSEGVGRGACFRITLPVADAPRGRCVAETTASSAHDPLRILIVDDSADVATSLEFLLRQAGHQISVATTGKHAIEHARHEHPQIILCDIGLPDLDGYAVAQAIRTDPSTASVYLIAMSGFGSDEDQRRSQEAGFDLHLNKPEGFVGLVERLQTLPIARR